MPTNGTATPSPRYEVYVDGALGGDREFWFFRDPAVAGYAWDAGDDAPGNVPWTARVARTSGGVLDDGRRYQALQNPNCSPLIRGDADWGVAPHISEGAVRRADGFARAEDFFFPGLPGYPNNPNIRNTWPATVRYFLRKFRLAVQWTDGPRGVPIPGRAIFTGATWDPWLFDLYENPTSPDPVPPNDVWLGEAFGWTPYQVTDGSGRTDFLYCVGMGVGYPSDANPNVTEWYLIRPGGDPDDTGAGVRFGFYEGEGYPLSSDHYLTQKPYLDSVAEWDVDYSTGWSAATGLLSFPVAEERLFEYSQSGKVILKEADGTAIPGTVSFGPYSGATGAAIPAVPRGSVLKNLRTKPNEPDWSADPLDELPLWNASDYPATTVFGEEDHLYRPENAVGNGAVDWEDYPDWSAYPLLVDRMTHDGKEINTLDEASRLPGPPSAGLNPPAPEDFNGGEVLTRPYRGTWRATDGSRRSGDFLLWVHEDRENVIHIVAPPDASPEGGDLDYCLDPILAAWLTEAQAEQVVQRVSDDLEATIPARPIMDAALSSPSRLIRPDHSHLLAAVESGAATVRRSADGETDWTATTVDDAATYAGVCLREDPAGALVLFLCDSAGSLHRRVSTDGGETWGAREAMTGLPPLAPLRPDARWHGGRWILAAATATGGVGLFGSGDGLAWESEATIASEGESPVFLVGDDGSLLVFYRDGSGIQSKRLSLTASGYSAEGMSRVFAGEDAGFSAFWTTRKAVCARATEEGIEWKRSFDGGDSWESGAEG